VGDGSTLAKQHTRTHTRTQTDRRTDTDTGRQTPGRRRQTQADTGRHRQTQADTGRHRQTQADRRGQTQADTEEQNVVGELGSKTPWEDLGAKHRRKTGSKARGHVATGPTTDCSGRCTSFLSWLNPNEPSPMPPCSTSTTPSTTAARGRKSNAWCTASNAVAALPGTYRYAHTRRARRVLRTRTPNGQIKVCGDICTGVRQRSSCVQIRLEMSKLCGGRVKCLGGLYTGRKRSNCVKGLAHTCSKPIKLCRGLRTRVRSCVGACAHVFEPDQLV
jgi:hypothetical protein